MNNPPIGTGTLFASTLNTGASSAGFATIYFLKNANASPIGTQSSTGSTSATSLSITSTTTSVKPFIISVMTINSGISNATFTNLTLGQYHNEGTHGFNSGYNSTATNASTVYSSGFTGASSSYCRMSLLEIKSL